MITAACKLLDIHYEGAEPMFCSYRLTYEDGTIWYAPHDSGNRHYDEMVEWIADGGTITEETIVKE